MTTRTFPTRSRKVVIRDQDSNHSRSARLDRHALLHQASLKGVGCDCLGLLRGVWRAIHGMEPEPLPAYTRDSAEANGEERLAAAARRHLIEIDSSEAAPGDVLLFRWRPHLPAKHAAILTGRARMIHA